MDKEKTTIGEEVKEIINSFVKNLTFTGIGCFCIYIGVVMIFNFFSDEVSRYESIVSIVIGTSITLFGLFHFLLGSYSLLSVCRYCSILGKTEISLKK